MRALVEREVVVPRADEATCRRYYEQNRRRFRSPDLFEVAHILFAAAPGDVDGPRPAARQAATALIAELRRAPGGLRRRGGRALGLPVAKQGGNLGQIGTGQTVAEFETALRDHGPGRRSSASRSRPATASTSCASIAASTAGSCRSSSCATRIADYLDEAVRRRALQQYVSILAGRASVTGVDLAAARGPLVQ